MIYALLIHDAHPEGEARPGGEGESLARHRALQAETVDREQLLAVARLDERSQACTLRPAGKGFELADGPYLETKEWLVGFYLVECDDMAAAVSRAEQICPASGSIEIRPVTWQQVP